MAEKTTISVRLDRKEMKHLRNLSSKFGGITPAIKALISDDMNEKNGPESDLFSVKNYLILQRLLRETLDNSDEILAEVEEQIADYYEI